VLFLDEAVRGATAQRIATIHHLPTGWHAPVLDKHVQTFLDDVFPGRWIGHGGPMSGLMVPWYHDCGFLSVRLCEVLCLHVICGCHWNHFCQNNWSIQSVVEGLLTHIWVEQDYHVDVIRTTSISHVEVD